MNYSHDTYKSNKTYASSAFLKHDGIDEFIAFYIDDISEVIDVIISYLSNNMPSSHLIITSGKISLFFIINTCTCRYLEISRTDLGIQNTYTCISVS